METEPIISPFVLYWILKLDTIQVVAGLVGVFGIILGGVGFLLSYCDDYGEIDVENESGQRLRRWIGRWMIVPVLAALLATFLPSSRQMAAIWLLPKVATHKNLGNLSGEAGEVWGLAKDWLRDQVEQKGDKEHGRHEDSRSRDL